MAKTILFQGDSITDCERKRNAWSEVWERNQPGYGYALITQGQMLCKHPESDLTFINRGVSGNRVVDLYARWKADALNLRPDIVTILIGINDTWHEFGSQNGVEPVRYNQVYRELLKWTKQVLPELKLVLLEPFVLPFGSASDTWVPEVDERRQMVRQIAADFGAEFVPLQEHFSRLAAAKSPDYYLVDGVHPTIAGHQVIAQQLVPVLEKLI